MQDDNLIHHADDFICFVAKNATPVAMTIQEIERESASDKELTALRKLFLLENGKVQKFV